MALNTRDRRFSMIGIMLPAPTVMPNPDGGFTGAGDRAHLLWLYRGIAAGEPVPDLGAEDNYLLLRRRRLRMGR